MNQTEIVKYLIANHAVYELAKSIAINGYLLNEEPIVCKEGDSYVVLERNRRVAACKILLNPYKFLSPPSAKELSKYEAIDDKIKCNIAPTRRDADTLIYNYWCPVKSVIHHPFIQCPLPLHNFLRSFHAFLDKKNIHG